MTKSEDPVPIVREILTRRNEELFWGGAALAAVGVAALVFPVASTFAVVLMVGWLLVLSGAVAILNAFTVEGTGPFFGELLLGLLKLAFGIYLFRHTDIGIVALTLLLATIFVVDGAVQMALAFELRPMDEWIWLLLSGLVSVGVGLLIAASLPSKFSLVALGAYMGISFLSTGVARIALSRRLSALLAKSRSDLNKYF
jgi:uncharacterized membrane protein HdeD (DUF308 family)